MKNGTVDLFRKCSTSMVERGVYDELAEMDELMKQYYHVRACKPQKLPYIKEQILVIARKMHITDDIGITEKEMEADGDTCVERLHV